MMHDVQNQHDDRQNNRQLERTDLRQEAERRHRAGFALSVLIQHLV